MYKNFFKRIIDFLLAVTAFIVLFPLFIAVAFILMVANRGGNPFFLQMRPGKNEKLFRVIKFKTMNDRKDKNGALLPDAQRLTKVGTIIRKTSLDEIPQLLNVLMGDMSIIGPRPLLIRYLPYFTEEERLRFSVRPGITGLAQVSGRNTVKWDERLRYDVEYVKGLTLALDLKIFFKTIQRVFTAENIVVDPESIMQNLDDERKSKIS